MLQYTHTGDKLPTQRGRPKHTYLERVNTMRHDETRDNVTDIEATIIEADNRAILHQGLGGIEGSDKTGRETWDERSQRMAEEAEDVGDDDYEDDGQPSEYEEWQDYMGGDEYYDHSESVWGEGY